MTHEITHLEVAYVRYFVGIRKEQHTHDLYSLKTGSFRRIDNGLIADLALLVLLFYQ